MRFFSSPASGTTSGSTLSASHEPPGRSGASHISQARPSTIRPTRLATASSGWRRRTGRDGAWRQAGHRMAAGRRAPGRPEASMIPAMNRRRSGGTFPLPLGQYRFVLGQRFREDRLGLTASSLTFTTTIALVPFFTVALALFTVFPMFSNAGRLQRWLIESLIPDNIARQVLGYLNQFASKASGSAWPASACCWSRRIALILTIDKTLNNIWRVRRRGLRAARAHLLGRDHARPAAAGAQPERDAYVFSASRGLVGGVPGVRASWCSTPSNSCCWPAAWLRSTTTFPTPPVKWAHAWAGGMFVAAAHRGGQARAGLLPQPRADLFGALRRLRDGADPAGVDLRGLGDRAAGRRHRSLSAEPDHRRGAARRRAGLAIPTGGRGAAAPGRRADQRRPGPGAAELAGRCGSMRCSWRRCSRRWSGSTGLRRWTKRPKRTTRVTCCWPTRPPRRSNRCWAHCCCRRPRRSQGWRKGRSTCCAARRAAGAAGANHVPTRLAFCATHPSVPSIPSSHLPRTRLGGLPLRRMGGACREYRLPGAGGARSIRALRFAWVDIEDHADLADNFDVETFPTIRDRGADGTRFVGPMLPHAGTRHACWLRCRASQMADEKVSRLRRGCRPPAPRPTWRAARQGRFGRADGSSAPAGRRRAFIWRASSGQCLQRRAAPRPAPRPSSVAGTHRDRCRRASRQAGGRARRRHLVALRRAGRAPGSRTGAIASSPFA